MIVACIAVVRGEQGSEEAGSDSYVPAKPEKAFYFETFGDPEQNDWVSSRDPNFGGQALVGKGGQELNIPGEKGLVLTQAAKRYGISVPFDTPFDPAGGTFVLQYDVRLHKQLQCGGAYIKALRDTGDPLIPGKLAPETPYTIMFGPDLCGSTDKVHFIFKHRNPLTGVYEEKHLKNPPRVKNDRLTHVYTIVVRSDNTFTLYIDLEVAAEGSLLEDFDPPVNPPAEIDDPSDSKPDDWVDEPRIPDPFAEKPGDWDEDAPRHIPDPNAQKPTGWLENEPILVADPTAVRPEDWDDDSDGDWEPPMVDNPVCKSAGCGPWKAPLIKNPDFRGKWSPPLIENPEYKGPWKARQIPNPDFFVDLRPADLAPMRGLAIEVWTMQDQIEFDNFYVGSDLDDAFAFARGTWGKKRTAEYRIGASDFKAAIRKYWPAAVTSILIGLFTVSFCCCQPENDRLESMDSKGADGDAGEPEGAPSTINETEDDDDDDILPLEPLDGVVGADGKGVSESGDSKSGERTDVTGGELPELN